MALNDTSTLDAELKQLQRAVRQSPTSAKAHADLGMALQRRGQFDAAITSQRRALKLNPKLTGLHGVMAPALYVLGHHEAAATSYRAALVREPGNANLHQGLGKALHALGQFANAELSYRRALEIAPADAESHIGIGAAQHGLARFDLALASFHQAIALAPELLEARLNLANTFHQLRQFTAAVAAYREVLRLKPDHYDALMNLAASCDSLGKFEDGYAYYQNALAARPGDPGARRNVAASLHRLGKHEQALAIRERLLESDPANGLFHYDLAQSLLQLGKGEAAIASLHRAIERRPEDPDIHTHLAYAQMECGDRDESLASYRRALALSPTAAAFSNVLFALSHSTTDADALYAAHLDFAATFETPLVATRLAHANQRDPGRRLNVGFVSADFYNHAVSTFIEPIFSLLTHSSELSLHAYYNGVVEDQITMRLRPHFAQWRQVASLDDSALEQQIRADNIDILIDMSGHSGGNRLTLFARKPAPIQASWIGYPGTTGLEAMDYYITDGFHLPEGRYDDQFTEQIVRIPLGAAFLPEPAAPPVGPSPALANGYLTFGTFNRANKLSREVIALWSALLRAVPTARLVLGGLHAGSETSVVSWFLDEGIARDRITVQPRGTISEYLDAHHQVDICLAPFPYTGATTVCHALWMGVPSLTVTGPTNPSHGAVCYMAHLGLTAFVADDDAHFIKLGVFLSENIEELAGLRATMRARFAASVAGQPVVAAAGLEHALRLMWQRHCADLAPQALRVRLSDLMTSEPDSEA